MSFQVIFPMAGLGSRFGYEFKPFIKATEDTFIELAKKSFDRLDPQRREFVFTFRRSQEKDHDVTATLLGMFPNDKVRCFQIDGSDGPFQTLQQTIAGLDLSGPTFVCDCDHRIDIKPLLKKYEEVKNEHGNFVIIPTWNIDEAEYASWGKVRIDDEGTIDAFCEKEFLDEPANRTVKGMIGCYMFSDISKVMQYANGFQNISDVLKVMLVEGYRLYAVDIETADFFGVPETLQAYRFKRAKKYTLFIDIDGTLIHQTTRELLPGTSEKLHEWSEQGHRIVLTTAVPSDRSQEIKTLLTKYDIPHDVFVDGLTPGPRMVINDKKPYLPYYCMAGGIELERNSGIGNVRLPLESPVIVKRFSGASFATVYLVRGEDGTRFIRKHISKIDASLDVHVDKLKRQLEDMKRFDFMCEGIVPKILGSYESQNEFYYDLEYLERYKTLSSFDETTIGNVLHKIFETLNENVYSFERSVDDKVEWMKSYLLTKVYPKFMCVPKAYKHLIFDAVRINDRVYPSLQDLVGDVESYSYFLSPDVVCPIHGDLTLENILYDADADDFKLIDNEGSRYYDAIELDIGKVFQSVVSRYAEWKDDCEQAVDILGKHEYRVQESFLDLDISAKKSLVTFLRSLERTTHKENGKNAEYDGQKMWSLKGVFFMTHHLIRMLPYMLKKSSKHFVFTLLLCRVYLTYVLENIPNDFTHLP